MKDIKFIAMIFMIFAMTAVLFISCEDKDSQSNEPANEELVCDPACGENQECKCVEAEDKSECKCEDKQTNETTEDKKCDPVCSESQECKCVESECKCEDKSTSKPVEDKKCDPACSESQECKCTEVGGKSECKCEDKQVVECKCEDGTACPENDKTKCVTTPVDTPTEDKKCDPVCSENKECKCSETECKCEDKQTDQVSPDVPKPEEKA